MRVANIKNYLGSADAIQRRKSVQGKVEANDGNDEGNEDVNPNGPLHESLARHVNTEAPVDIMVKDLRKSVEAKSAVETFHQEQRKDDFELDSIAPESAPILIEADELEDLDTYMLSVWTIDTAGSFSDRMCGSVESNSVLSHSSWTACKDSTGTASTMASSTTSSSGSTSRGSSSRRRHPGALRSRLKRCPNSSIATSTTSKSCGDGWRETMEMATQLNSCAWTPERGMDFQQTRAMGHSFVADFGTNSFGLEERELSTGIWHQSTAFEGINQGGYSSTWM